MRMLHCNGLLDFLTAGNLLVGVLWLGLAVLTVTLLALMWTRWGQYRPLRKCLVLSLLAHLLMAGYASTVHIVAALPAGWGEPLIRVAIGGTAAPPAKPSQQEVARENPWDELISDSFSPPQAPDPAREQPDAIPEPQRQTSLAHVSLDNVRAPKDMACEDAPLPEPKVARSEIPTPKPTAEKSAEPIQAPAAQRRDAPDPALAKPTAEERPAAIQADKPLVPTLESGLPAALLEHRVGAPRASDEATTADPASSLAGLLDVAANVPKGKPADATTEPAISTGMTSKESEDPAYGSSRGGLASGEAKAAPSGGGANAAKTVELSSDPHRDANWQPPAIYGLRGAGDRSSRTRGQGCTAQSEAAVTAALQWLANNQAADGHWDARTHGAGQEMMTDGQNRQNAGVDADTGMTGLAILAFLASGHTHQSGDYQDHVRRGLTYLIRSQAPNGHLGGQTRTYAAMYCHAIAAFALSEGYGMTGDEQLRTPVERALRYTVAAQDPSGGGWRYQPGDSGDTSQLGWQLMVIKSAELAGIRTPVNVHQGAIRFLHSVSSGRNTGLAGYRPGQPPTRPMTAEAMVCRQFLGMPPNTSAAREATDYLMSEEPGTGRANFYYWYYATLAVYQVQDPRWEQWNKALQDALVNTQQTSGALAGSWDPDPVWGGYGGRVYSTALGALCLEVYYRYLPLYTETSAVLKPVR